MKTSTKKSKNKQLTIAVGQALFPAWQEYTRHLRKLGVTIIVLDLFNPGWADRLNKVKDKVDAYLWHADTWDEDYRKIHDRIYFIEKFIKKPVFPNMNMYYSYNDKLKQYEIFKHLKLPIIPTSIAFFEEKAIAIASKLSYPVVVKDSYGAVGEGVIKVNSKRELKKKINNIFSKPKDQNIKKYLYLQEFIPNMDRDLRVITIGNKIASAYWRIGHGWKHNISGGASPDFNSIPKSALDFCLKISKEQKFHWMSYDLFVLPSGKLKLIEWSCNFGVKGPLLNHINIRKMQMEYLVNILQNKKK
jgi:ribosomal protein S6--L-glutamate ligase